MLKLILAMLMMMLASVLPRAIPLVLMRKEIKSTFIKSILAYMPYAVLSALTFPSIFYSTGDMTTAIIGTSIALVMSLFKINLAIVAVVCVGVVFGLGYVI